jgi:outer membrane protein TolC
VMKIRLLEIFSGSVSLVALIKIALQWLMEPWIIRRIKNDLKTSASRQMKTHQILNVILVVVINLGIPAFSQVNPLNYFIEQGLKHSPVLKEIKNQVGSNGIDSLLIKARQRPQVSYNGLLYYAPVIQGVGYSEVITNISNISSAVYVTQRVFNQKSLEARYDKLDIMNQSLRISLRITENDLKKSITLQYLAACQVSDDLRFNREINASMKDEESILKQWVEKGLYKQTDYLSFMVQFRSQEIMLKMLDIQYQKEVTALNSLCGLPDTSYDQLELPQIVLFSRTNISVSPYLKRFTIDSLAILNEKLEIDQNYKPSFNWFSDAGLLSNVPREIGRNIGFSVGLSLSVPIYDGNQRKLNYEKLKIAENTRQNYAGYFKMQLSLELQHLYMELKKTREMMPLAEQQLAFAESVLSQDRNLLNKGEISVTDFVVALNNYISVKRSVNQVHVRILGIITEINYWNQ